MVCAFLRIKRSALHCVVVAASAAPASLTQVCRAVQLIMKVRQALHAKTSRAVRVEGVSVNVEAFVAWDNAVKSVVAKAHSSINDNCLKAGLRREFPANAFSLMIGTGAKGSPVNHTMIVGGLGQQVCFV